MDEKTYTYSPEGTTRLATKKGTTVGDCLRVGTEAYLQYCTDPECWDERRAKQWAAVLKAILALGPEAVR